MHDVYLTPREVEITFALKRQFLAKTRLYGGGPKFIRVSARKILYRRSDVASWLAAREHSSTSEYGRAA